MKKISALAAVVFFACFLLSSCSKQSINDEVSPGPTNIINITIGPNQVYHLAISEPGEVSIVKQAKHYKISETAFEAEGGQMRYSYLPSQDYTGIEEIVLSNKKAIAIISGGCNSSHDNNSTNPAYTTVYTMLRINISN